jgi:hypothetical protein
MIHLTDSGFAAGTIIVAAATQPRFYEFQLALDRVGAPVDTKLHIERSCDITQNFNGGIEKMIGEWAWFLGDDHSFSEDTLMRLLKRDVDVVVPITSCKRIPFMPCVMHGPDNGEVWHNDLALYHWDELSGEGLFPLPKGDFIGQAGMLVKKHVLDKIGYPWFKCGQLDKGRLQEDMYFCHELQQLGYTVHIDQEIVLDHYFLTGISARKHDGKWNPALTFGKDTMILPDAKPKPLAIPKRVGKSLIRWASLPTENTYEFDRHTPIKQ